MTEGFDVGLEMSGAPPAFRTMLDTMNHGGRIAMLGIPPSDMSIDWNKVIFKGLFIKGIYGREMFETRYKMAALISLVWTCPRLSLTVSPSMSSSRALTRCVRASQESDPELG